MMTRYINDALKDIVPEVLLLVILFTVLGPGVASAEPLSLPNISLTVGGNADSPDKVATVIQLLFILTVLSLTPAILLMLTSFTRIVIVLSLLRQAMGTQQMPSNQIIIGLSLFLTFFIMSPVWQSVHSEALKPYYDEEISGEQAIERAVIPVKAFMLKQTREKDIALFLQISKGKRPEKPADLALSVLVPAFVISELKTAFQIGFLLFLPFFIIDMVVASVLLSMGMMMLPPIMMSLPFKLLLFVLVDGWYLIIGSLVQSFH
ncbi:flagellar type III secretion system pore protein FliP [Syntrophus aciditrophicus]|uniref:Flagellar biosynthetic protein FliP n=1 Tax=Syntrophus aciditrophicus (strain SB) TaxID=56780 RepID=Q2LT00_SYNAS|nr:flagellar type III secretion system pore protein FliP [Syntrophus aciditrophicus]ABC77214.1 flagellar biosynthetic protein [Syntrophus aciditrophicus SB]OPY17285.1 MAG: Flagellar biosynthetic protein FliP precursor [Syntrophus sp. PtaB.Bin075]